MIRETLEETGLKFLPDMVREYGFVHRIQKSTVDETECFIQDNYYYLCGAADTAEPQDPAMLEREARILEMLITEGSFGDER